MEGLSFFLRKSRQICYYLYDMKTISAVSYLRTSSAANVGSDKDSDVRQRKAIGEFADRNGFHVVREFYDAAVSGADHVDSRPGFRQMLEWMAAENIGTIIVENASRFARDLMVQEVGHAGLKAAGIHLVAADSPFAFMDDTPTAKLIRQVLGCVSEFDKAMTVAKLRGARDRKRATGVKVEGRKSLAELHPDIAHEAKLLYRKPARKQRLSLRVIATILADKGFVSSTGKPFTASSVKSLVS